MSQSWYRITLMAKEKDSLWWNTTDSVEFVFSLKLVQNVVVLIQLNGYLSIKKHNCSILSI